MKNKIGLLIAIIFLGYGLTRIGVGGLILAQTLEIVNFPELNDTILNAKKFISLRANQAFISFTVKGYFGYIIVMGIFLSIGAVYTLFCSRWGFFLLWIYVCMHAALFINFLEINIKIIGLVLQVILLFALNYLRSPKRLNKTK